MGRQYSGKSAQLCIEKERSAQTRGTLNARCRSTVERRICKTFVLNFANSYIHCVQIVIAALSFSSMPSRSITPMDDGGFG